MKLKEVYRVAKGKASYEVRRFMRDMKKAGLKMRYYQGRFYWKGPAVVTDDLQEVLSSTKVKCQWDSMGLGYVVYPKQGI